MTLKVTDNSKIVIKGLEKLRAKAINTKPLMLQIAEDMKTKVDMRFRHSKNANGVMWDPLKESTVSKRRKGSSKPLIDTGELRSSINSKATDNVAIVGTNKEYAAMQNFGAKKGDLGSKLVDETVREHQRRRRVESPWGNVPARRFIGFSKNQVKHYAALINKHLKGDKQ